MGILDAASAKIAYQIRLYKVRIGKREQEVKQIQGMGVYVWGRTMSS